MSSEKIMELIINNKEEYFCAAKFSADIEKEYNIHLSINEIVYLMMFILGDSSNKREEQGIPVLVAMHGDGVAFVIARTVQVHPYLVLADQDSDIADMIAGVIIKQVRCILTDPYANAFNEWANGNCWERDEIEMKPEVWERKFEIVSLCYPIQLAYLFWKNSGRGALFADEFKEAMKLIVKGFYVEQDHEHLSSYRFQRSNCIFADILSRDGKGYYVNGKTRLLWSGFRASDDVCSYGNRILSKMFALVVLGLGYLSKINKEIYRSDEDADDALKFVVEIRNAIEKYGIVSGRDKLPPFYTYEVDGYG